jgi:MtN3 and saliva related transmembrane protein
MQFIQLVGLVAGTLTTGAYLPQVLRAWRTRSTRDVSLKMYLVMVTGTALWLVYGIALWSWPIMLSNGASLILTCSILILKLRYG